MHTVVLGAGAVGGYFGGKLALKGYPVTFLVRPKRYEQLRNRGLKVESLYGNFHVQPTLAANPEEIDQPDLVIIAVKNYHLQGAINHIEILVKKGAKLLPLLNGIEHHHLLKAKFGVENVLGGLCYIESTLNEDGDVIHTSALQDVIFGPLVKEQEKIASTLYEMMKKAGINVTLSHSIIPEIWKKLIFLAALSGITTTTRQPIGISLQDSVTFDFLQRLVEEIYAVAKAENVPLEKDIVQQTMAKLQSISPQLTSSMHRDLEKGLPLELDALHGYLIKASKKYHLPTPCLDAIYALLHPYKNGKI
jgi:2-dehydropantoate 2-reductase